MSDDLPRRKLRWYLVALLALVLVVSGIRVLTLAHERDEALRQAEALRIEAEAIEGVLVARTAESRELRAQVGSLLERIHAIEAEGPEIREVVRWRTRTVSLPCDEPIAPGADSNPDPALEAPGSTPPTPAPPPERPSLSLYVVGREARLTTRAGNWLAVGEVDLVRERDDEVLVTLPWEADASDLLVSDISLSPRDERRWLVGLGPGLVDGELGVGALVVGPAWEPRLFRRSLGRWRPWATGVVANVDTLVPVDYPSTFITDRAVQACAAGGIGLEW